MESDDKSKKESKKESKRKSNPMIKELSENEFIKTWFAARVHKPNSREAYLLSIVEYVTFLQMTPEELIKEAESEEDTNIKMRSRSIKNHMLSFHKHLVDKGVAPLTVKARMTGVISFYRAFDIEIPQQPTSETKAKPLQKHRSIPTREDIRDALKLCDPLEKAIVLVGVSSGLAVREITNLKIRDFRKGYDPKTEITTLQLRREKTQYDFVTFLSPEASRAVIDYLNFRGRDVKLNARKGENIKRKTLQLEKQRIYADDNYLFIQRSVTKDYIETHTEELRKLDVKGVMGLYRSLSERAGKSTDLGTFNLLRSHNMRKFFFSTIMGHSDDFLFAQFCMGHEIDKTTDAYLRYNTNQLREKYIKYIEYLTINEEDELKAINEKLLAERVSVQDLKAELDATRAELEGTKEELFERILAEIERDDRKDGMREIFEIRKEEQLKAQKEHDETLKQIAEAEKEQNEDEDTLREMHEVYKQYRMGM